MKKTGKWLWCSNCKEYPNEIEERYSEPAIEYRVWSKEQDCYELDDTNFDMDNESKNFCAKCGTELEEKQEK